MALPDLGPDNCPSDEKLRFALLHLERRIAVLVAIRDGMRRTIKLQDSVTAGTEISNRSKSFEREVVFCRIEEELRASETGCLSTQELFRRIRVESPLLKYVTFRSYLHRMKKRGKICSDEKLYGNWRLPNDGTPGG